MYELNFKTTVEDIYKMYNIPVNRLYGKPSVIYFLLSKCTYCFSENDSLISLIFLCLCTSAIEHFYY